MKLHTVLLGSVAMVLYATPAFAVAETKTPTKAPAAAQAAPQKIASVGQLQNVIVSQQKRLNAQEAAIKQQQSELQQLKAMMQQIMKNKNGVPMVATNSAAANAQAKTVEVRQSATSATGGSAETVAQVGLKRRPKPKVEPVQIAALPKEGGVLLHPGKIVLEPSLEYSRSSALTVAVEGFTIIPALNIGSFDISQVDRDTVTSAFSARMGIFPRFELTARVPYIYRADTFASRPIGTSATSTTLSDVSGNALGDMELTGSYQLNRGLDGWPFLIGNVRFKSATGMDPFEVKTNPTTGQQLELPTGSGFYAVQPSITAILPSDPAVLYGTLGYTFNMARNVGGTYGEIDPGDGINLSMGMGFAINEKSSFSLGYSHDMIFETLQNGQTIPTSSVLQVGQLNTGFAYKMNERVNLNLNLSAGVTDDAPDLRVGFRVPVRMDLW